MKSIKILLADDHEGFRRSLYSFLRAQAGVEIIGEARDGDEAVEKAVQLHPDLVLIDLDMPNRDGFDATKEIKQLSPDTKVVILSMHGGEVYRRMAWKNAADGFIDKSSMKNALLTLLLNEHDRLNTVAVGVHAA